MAVEIIADIGINHQGRLETAKSLANAAKICGADFCKFQTWFRNDWPDLEYLKFSKDQWRELFAFCDSIGMPWFATPFDLESIAFLKECGMKVWKVPSGMVTNKPYLEAIKETAGEDRIIFSTGMATKDEVWEVAKFFGDGEALYCVSEYPAPAEDISLPLFGDMGFFYDGFSDHSEDDALAVAAVGRGAKIIEKHLTLDRNQPGPDHKASMDPVQFAEMVRKIRNVEEALRPKPISEREYAQRDIIRARMAFKP